MAHHMEQQNYEAMLDNQRCDRQDLLQLMAQGHSILHHSLSQSDATPAGIKVVFNHIIHPLNWRQLRLPIRDGPAARRASGHWPCAALAAEPLARRWRAAWRSSKSCGRSASAGWAILSAGRKVENGALRSFTLVSESAAAERMISALTLAGVSSQTASFIPAGSALITGGYYLRCNQNQTVVKCSIRRLLARSRHALFMHTVVH